ncbi:MAG: flagellar basal body rod protein FlgB [Deltaproteobacteria bacterium]|jgi:flagellar basal-body rod protein FlgB|nr:flagellar basal body rod protein FlgB [Deltaproteobacteria bacterium]
MIRDFNHNLFGSQFGIMEGTLGLRLARHDFTSTNLANKDVPGFRAKHLNFEKVLAQRLPGNGTELDVRQTSLRHMPTRDTGSAFARAQQAIKMSPYGFDEYNDDKLDIDKEMTLLTKNQLIYNTTVQMLAKEFDTLKYAIGEGGSR